MLSEEQIRQVLHASRFEFIRPLDDLETMLPNDFAGRRLSLQAIYEEHASASPMF